MNWQFNNIEFRGMMFNPSKVSETDSVFKIFPDLSKYKIFRASPGPEINNNLVMLFIMCMYDKATPYRGKFSDVLKRKIEIANDVGFKVDDHGEFETPIEQMLKGQNEVVNGKIVEYVRMHRNFKYTYLVTIEASYYALMLDVMSDATAKRINDLRNIQEELEATAMDLVNEDNNPHLKDTVLRYVEEIRLGLRPEDIAKALKNKKAPVKFKI